MKRLVVPVFAAALLAFPAAQANAASSATPTVAQFKALQKQVKALQAQVKALQKWVPKSCSSRTCLTLPAVSGLAAFGYAVNICEVAVISDEFQATWNVIDQISTGTPVAEPSFGPQTPISDKGACSDVQITRSTAVPPNVSIFNSLLTLLTS